MTEKEIKGLFLERIIQDKNDSIVVNEYAGTYWKRRADLLVVNDLLHIIEIKSERDNLSRLNSQLEFFLGKAHRVTLIVDYTHRNRLSIPQRVRLFWVKDRKLVLEREPVEIIPSAKELSTYWRLNELKLLYRGIIKGAYKMHLDKLQEVFSALSPEIAGRLTCGLLKARYRKYFQEVKKAGKLFIPRVAKYGLEDPKKDYPEFFEEVKLILRRCFS